MARELEHAGCLDDASLVWSMWRGYFDDSSSDRLREWLGRLCIGVHQLHSSGHATSEDLRRLAGVLGGRIVPIHTGTPDRYAELFDCVEPHANGEWWPV